MKKYDDMVVGSGISGLTLALLLGMNGHKVLLLEKNTRIGGSLNRFHKKGIPFDIGLHFTGGLSKSEILYKMLEILGINECIKPRFLTDEKNNKYIFEAENAEYYLPAGINNLKIRLKKYFPGEKQAIDKYFEMVENVYSYYVSTDLREIFVFSEAKPENFISLDNVLNQLTQNKILKALLSVYCLCYGTKPAEISFTNHSLMVYNLYESLARVENGGDSFISAFSECLKKLGVDIMCGKYITECLDIENKCAGRFLLNTGEEILSERCVFTIHPKEILKALPKEHLKKAFIDRLSNFEPSAGFFSLYGITGKNSCDNNADNSNNSFEPSFVSWFPTTDFNQLLDPEYKDRQTTFIMRNQVRTNGKIFKIISALELSFPEHMEEWKDSKTGNRPYSYTQYKEKHINDISRRIVNIYPEYKDSFEVISAASVLTFRDYLCSYDGSAYGIKQKMGQYNLFGKLPLRNIYAAGQSSLLPGIIGAMMSSFIIGREILGKQEYNSFIEKRLCN